MTAIGLDNGNICFWDVNNWVCKKTIREHKKGVSDIKRDAKGVLLVSVAGREMIFWNIANLSALYHYKFDFGTYLLMKISAMCC
jgi:WD40 repeat protein